MGTKKTTPEEARRVIDALGGTNAVARLCGIKSPSVSSWKKNGIPHSWVRFLSLLRPDLFKVGKNSKR